MGVWGWDEIEDNVTVKGAVIGKADYNGDDGDWSFSVKPALTFKHLLTNQSGFTNKNKRIECEIQPPDDLDQGQSQVDQLLNKPAGQKSLAINQKWVTVVGTWVRDRSHSVDGSSIIPVVAMPVLDPIATVTGAVVGAFVETDPNKGKTEIHPITSILIEHPPATDNRSRIIDFFVFSSGGSTTRVPDVVKAVSGPVGAPFLASPGAPSGFPGAPSAPHTDEDRVGTCEVLVPIAAFTQASSFEALSVLDQSATPASTAFSFVPSGLFYRLLRGRVRSGRISEGKGFYHARIKILPGYTLRTYLASRGLDPKLGIRKWVSQWLPDVTKISIRGLFSHLYGDNDLWR